MTDTLPLVSIITPAYNRASYLDETIQSVLEQHYLRIEYIVLDDGSTDNTSEVLHKYSGQIIWESHPNMGEHRTVNRGFSMAHGEIVAVVNSDDPLRPGAVSTAVSFMQAHPDVIVGYPDWDFIGPNSEVIGHVQVPEYDYLRMVRRHQPPVGPGAFVRRRAIQSAGVRDPGLRYVGDYDFWLRLGLHGKFARIPGTLATYRAHPDAATVSQRGDLMADEHVRVMEKFYSLPDLPREVRKVRAESFSWAHAAAAMTACKPTSLVSLKHLMKAFLYHPWSLPDKLAIGLPLVIPIPVLKLLPRRIAAQAAKRKGQLSSDLTWR